MKEARIIRRILAYRPEIIVGSLRFCAEHDLLDAIPLIAVYCVGLFLRMVCIDEQSVWLDEVATLASAVQPTLNEVIRMTYATERIPPLYPMVMHMWTRMFGFSEFSIRLPSAIFGSVTIPVLYALSRRLFDRKVGLMCAFLLAISPYHIWYSQEARFFAMFVFFNLLSILFFINLEGSSRQAFSRTQFVGYLLTTCVAAYLNYFMIFTVIAQNIVMFFGRKKNREISTCWFSGQLVLLLVCLIPLCVVLVKQVSTLCCMYQTVVCNELGSTVLESGEGTSNARIRPVEGTPAQRKALAVFPHTNLEANIFNSLSFLVKDTPYALATGLKYINQPPYHWSRLVHFTFILPCIALVGALFFCGMWRAKNERLIALIILFFVPIITVFLVKLSGVESILLSTRHVIHVLPLFCVFVALGLYSLGSAKLRMIALSVLVLYTVLSLNVYYYDTRTYKDRWRYVTSYVLDQFASDDFIVFHGEYSKSAFLYYVYTNSKNRTAWEMKEPSNVEIRGRDGSLNLFLNRNFCESLSEKKRVWAISYYAMEKERVELSARLARGYSKISQNPGLGKHFYLDLYQKKEQ